MTSRQEFFAGIRATLPLMVGVAPFGFIYGALAAQLGLPSSIAQAMSLVIFGGSAQFIAAPLIVAGAPALVLVLTVFAVNLRHALYSASLAPHLEKLSAWWKMLLAYMLTDEAYAVAIAHYQKAGNAKERHWYLFGVESTLWIFWQASTLIGIFVGAQAPSEWALDFALPLTFIAIVVPMLKNRAYLLCAIAAAIGGVVAFGLPYKLGYIVAAMVAIAVGFALETRVSKT
ncbi:MAG: branched-chain amino acid ABC transporter permease [Chloroflexi bacterium UTCFX4]|jgi:4-azaleucine resistance transporter AzlC|nr:MAG: branched-chain amino acid ABC transporter permease [Chloroflexi bacterium UTCFX4]